ncbi:hypothetical protein [Oryzisolibacter sp. LB2S]|uniref:hypothetical protein n=1 Tax=Alicycliphilus soli TaxID=3228789 RepID=UPI00345ADD99
MLKVAALFVRSDSHYKKMGCDCYDFERNALTWPGGVPSVAHPPCRAWGQLSQFAKPRDGEKELAPWAVEQVRRFGGVVEHPYASRLWAVMGCGGFGLRDRWGGVLIPVMQSWWGHRAPKKTALYIVGPVPALPDPVGVATGRVELMGKREREMTPFEFARFLVDIARESKGFGGAV